MRTRLTIAALTAALLLTGVALADRGPEGGHGREHVDNRHGHNHSYPDRGVIVRSVPREARIVSFGRDRYWFHGGVWYRAQGPRFIVVGPPFGIFVPVLPPFYTTVMIGGIPYYYANDAYYVYRDPQQGYQVVEPPPGVDAMAAGPPPGVAGGLPPGVAGSPPTGGDNIFVYPKNGQSPDQQAKDRYECHRWAADQTGFDPTRGSGGVPPEQAGPRRADYYRAMNACLEGRGYTVR
jgi:hypothetical protein